MNFHPGHPLVVTYKWARRIAIAVVGFTVLAVGIAMIVLPGPAIVVIPVGLGILGLEFAWARHWLHTVRERGTAVFAKVKSKKNGEGVNEEEARPGDRMRDEGRPSSPSARP